MKYYLLVKLENKKSIIFNNESLLIDLDKVDLDDTVCDDEAFNRSVSDETFFWVSGGGTYLLNGRYIVLVKRGDSARVNPGKFSLFTGRADSVNELVNPVLLVRELFEELILFADDAVLYPLCEQYQSLIDDIYQDFAEKKILGSDKIEFVLKPVNGFERQVCVGYQGEQHNFRLNYHINKKNDVNVLFLFSANVDMKALKAKDGEYQLNHEEVIWHNRDIYLYDVMTSNTRSITDGSRVDEHVFKNDMTEHAWHMVSSVRSFICKESSQK